MLLPQFYVDDIIKTALQEDINYLDTTTDLMIPATARSTARFMAKAEGVVCGLEIALRVFTLLDNTFSARVLVKDGDTVRPGELLAELEGRTRFLLKGERTALNLLQHLSGVATATRRAVDIVKGTDASIADTRKTLPGLRAMQKYAVTVGGGRNHRFNLSDGAMLKDNHIDAAGGIPAAVSLIREIFEADPDIDGAFHEVAVRRGHELERAEVSVHLPAVNRFYEEEYLRIILFI